MGGGIAGLFVKSADTNNQRINLRDVNEDSLNDGVSRVKDLLNYSKAINDATKEVKLARLDATLGESVEWIGDTNVVIEAVSENPKIKKMVLAGIAEEVPENALIGTNTSSLSVTDLAASVKNPERFVGIHFFNPPGAMPLVEVVRGAETSDDTIAKACELAGKLGKTPIVVEDVPCFLVNRMFSPYLNEAAFLLEDGASIKQIDRAAMKFGMKMGPLRTLDEVGFDIAKEVSKNALEGYGERMKGPDHVEKLIEMGLLGYKGGEGFYKYRGDWDKKGVPNTELLEKIGVERPPFVPKTMSEELIQKRLMLSMVNEAVRALDDGVAGSNADGSAARQIDIGSVFGMGFAPFRGGVMKYAESLGAWEVLKELRELESKFGSRFAPCMGIIKRAQEGKSFYEEI
jgi:3-hydroxyacyl-CoA dehydrogenase/enoyl-CoA hydratase/3-hydroxybutyryl-CoA epimerase